MATRYQPWSARHLGCVFQDMKPPKSIFRKRTYMQKPIQRVKFTKTDTRNTIKIRDKILRTLLPKWTCTSHTRWWRSADARRGNSECQRIGHSWPWKSSKTLQHIVTRKDFRWKRIILWMDQWSKNHISLKTGWGFPATRRTSFPSCFQACQIRLLDLTHQLRGLLNIFQLAFVTSSNWNSDLRTRGSNWEWHLSSARVKFGSW